MSYIDVTQLNDLQVTGGTDEKRPNRHGLIEAVKAGTPLAEQMIPEASLAELRKMSGARSIKLPVFKDSVATVSTSPSFTIPSNLPETDFYTVLPIDIVSGYRVYPDAFDNNVVDINKYVKAQSMRVFQAMADKKEEILATNFEAYKTQVFGYTTEISQGAGAFVFNTTPDELEISLAAQKETMFNYLSEGMYANKIAPEAGGQLRIITQPAGLAVQKAELAKYGAGNEKNLQALGQFTADQMYTSDSLSLAASSTFNGWLLRDGEMGLVSNFPSAFRNGTVVGEKKWSISDMEMPFIQSRVNVFVNRDATNATAQVTASPVDSNLEMTHFEEIMFWDRQYVLFAYSSDRATRPQGIVKLRGKDS